MFSNIEDRLKQSATDKTDVVKCNVFVTEFDDIKLFNEKYSEFFGEHRPARSLVVVKALPMKGAMVEMEMISLN